MQEEKLRISILEGSVLDELGLDQESLLELKLKAALHQHILKIVGREDYSGRDLEKLFDVSQPRVSELMRGKLSLISVKKLLQYVYLLGFAVSEVKLKKAKVA